MSHGRDKTLRKNIIILKRQNNHLVSVSESKANAISYKILHGISHETITITICK